MADLTRTMGNSLIQHGRENDRVYLMDPADADLPGLLSEIEELAARHQYGKIFAKARAGWQEEFRRRGYRLEAETPGLYPGSSSGPERENGLFWGKFLNPGRAADHEQAEITAILKLARAQGTKAVGRKKPLAGDHYRFRKCTPADCPEMAALFGRVFASYPFPVDDPAFLAQNMESSIRSPGLISRNRSAVPQVAASETAMRTLVRESVRSPQDAVLLNDYESTLYYGAWRQGRLAAIASAELALAKQNVEMTDFATAPEDRGQGVAALLLAGLEKEAADLGIRVAYTIARAKSAAINLVFARAGYSFDGTLVNNTQICGHLESMNVWSKPL